MPNFKIYTAAAALALLPFSIVAQQTEMMWNPEVSYSWKRSDRLGFNTKLSVFNSITDLNNNGSIEYIEPQLVVSYGLSNRTKIGGGYYYRLSTPFLDGHQYEHRFLEQIGFISNLGDQKLVHRLRLEQRIKSSSYQHRIRYRISIDLPLIAEKYLIFKNEMMSAFNKEKATAENRFSLGMGWKLNRKQKFELGFQYRTLDIANGSGINHLFLLSTNYYLKR